LQNKGFPIDFLYQLKQKCDIVAIVSRYVKLDRKGSRYWGCCPFHNEKTPSFSVMQDEGVYHCFGCKEHGDVISFVQKMESCEFMDAVKLLAQEAHMEMPEFKTDDDTHKRAEKRERLLKLLEETWKHYHENIYLKEAKPAQDYIKSRNFTKHELDDFKLGYSLNWTEMVEHLKSKGFTYEDMVDAGVAQSKNGRYYDVMAERLVFPIFNSFNDCVGFSARVLDKNSDFAKYKNTAETMVFQKSKVVFGINLLKALKQSGKLDKVIIVEGQIDVIAMHRAGFKNTVACMGSALTLDNAQALKRISRNIVLCFDGDGAGQKATLHSLDVLDKDEFNIRVVALPDKMDPDEVLKNKGRDFLAALIEGAMPVMDYLIEVEKKNFNLSKAEERGGFAKAVLAHLKKMVNSPSLQEPYLEKLRDLTSIPIDVLRRDLQGGQKEGKPIKKEEEKVLISRENGNNRAVKFVLSSLIHNKPYVNKNIDYVKLMPRYKEVIEKAKEGTRVSSYYDLFDVGDMPLLEDCLVFNFEEYGESAERYFEECLWTLADQILKEKQQAVHEQFKASTSLEERQKLMLELNKILKELREKSLEEFYVR